MTTPCSESFSGPCYPSPILLWVWRSGVLAWASLSGLTVLTLPRVDCVYSALCVLCSKQFSLPISLSNTVFFKPHHPQINEHSSSRLECSWERENGSGLSLSWFIISVLKRHDESNVDGSQDRNSNRPGT